MKPHVWGSPSVWGCLAGSLDEVHVEEATPCLGWWSFVSDQAVKRGPAHHLRLISRRFMLASISNFSRGVTLTLSYILPCKVQVFCLFFCVSLCVLASCWFFCTEVKSPLCLFGFQELSLQVKRRLWFHLCAFYTAPSTVPSVSGGKMSKDVFDSQIMTEEMLNVCINMSLMWYKMHSLPLFSFLHSNYVTIHWNTRRWANVGLRLALDLGSSVCFWKPECWLVSSHAMAPSRLWWNRSLGGRPITSGCHWFDYSNNSKYIYMCLPVNKVWRFNSEKQIFKWNA